MRDEMTKLQRARVARAWSQTRLIAAMKRVAPALGICLPEIDSLKTNIRRWENDHIVPGPDYRRVLRAVYGMTDAELGFPSCDQAEQLRVVVPPALSIEGLAYFESLLSAHISADNRIGPHQVLGLVEHEAQQLNSAAREARGALRSEVIKMAMRFMEFQGWLQQDSGRFSAAMASTDRARDLAAELGDPLWDAYLLMRKSNVATDAGDPATGAALAEVALDAAAPPPRVGAVILRQKANALAALGHARDCAAAIDKALSAVCNPEAEGDEIASYCSERYVAMEAAGCWRQLRQPGRALQLLSATGSAWPDALRRDNGLYLARLASAHAGAGDVLSACSIGAEAVAVAGVTHSVRTIIELRRLRGELAAAGEGKAEALFTAVDNLLGIAA
jgi:hypothetical protein